MDSAVVVMERRESPLVSDDIRNDFLSLVRQLFSQRRKTVRNNLSSAFSKDRLEEAFRATGMSGMERAEKLSFDELVSLCRALQ